MLLPTSQTRSTRVLNNSMNQNFSRMLQKYNINPVKKTLSERICEPDRFKNFHAHAGDLLFDFSRTGLDQQALKQFLELAESSGIEEARQRLFDGENINFTENRPAMHMAMRCDDVLDKLGAPTVTRVSETRRRMLEFASAFAAGHLPGNPDQCVRHIIHIGIGGSVLGPRLLIEALGKSTSLQVHFLSSVDAHLRKDLLASLDPAETAVIIATKSFTTGETLLHARRVLQWMENAMGRQAAFQRLFAVSGNQPAVEAFGVSEENTLYLPDWVGGRYSIWSAVSLAAAAVMGEGGFSEFLSGAAAMDRHFQTAALPENLPVLMALTPSMYWVARCGSLAGGRPGGALAGWFGCSGYMGKAAQLLGGPARTLPHRCRDGDFVVNCDEGSSYDVDEVNGRPVETGE